MIIDLRRFLEKERPYWNKLEKMLIRLEDDPGRSFSLDEIKEFHYLYQRTSSGLAKISTFSSEFQLRQYLESLVGRAYSEIHEIREKPHRLAMIRWFFVSFPHAFRKHCRAFWASLAITLVGCAFGGIAVTFDPEAKEVIVPFEHLMASPSERVAQEETAETDRLAGHKGQFSSTLMTHNTRVAILVLALGMTWGMGTIVLLFYNGVILGAVALDYILSGETAFLAGWLLPHGVVEIPAILLAGQAGLILAGALIGWGTSISLKMRLRRISNDLVTLIGGVAIMLVWAGIVESFFSQYHEPTIPYEVKIGFGIVELVLLVLFLSKSGKTVSDRRRA